MINAFWGCQNMELTATDTADMSQVTSYSQGFRDCKAVTSFPNAENWVTSNTTTCYLMFYNCIENTSIDTSGCPLSLRYVLPTFQNFTLSSISVITFFFFLPVNISSLYTSS